MATAETASEGTDRKPSKMPVLIGIFLAVIGGGGGFFVAYSNLLPLGDSESGNVDLSSVQPLDVGFVPLAPIIVSLGPQSENRHLKFSAQLEVEIGQEPAVQELIPRIVDVLNGYLRAIETSDLESPAALMTLRAQMLRRVQIVVGEGRVRDLLIMEFVLN